MRAKTASITHPSQILAVICNNNTTVIIVTVAPTSHQATVIFAPQ